MTPSIQYWMRLLLLLFGTLSALSLVMTLAWRGRSKRAAAGSRHWSSIWGLSLPQMMTKMQAYLTRAGMIAIWVILGFAGNDLWRFHHTYVLNDLTVIAVPGDTVVEDGKERTLADLEYYLERMEEPRGQSFPFNVCPDYDPKLKVGNHIKVIVYEVKFFADPPCRDVGGGGKNGIIVYK